MEIATAIKVWMAVKPIKRIRVWRNKRRERKGKPLLKPTEGEDFMLGQVSKLIGAAIGYLAGLGVTAIPALAPILENASFVDGLIELVTVAIGVYFAPKNAE